MEIPSQSASFPEETRRSIPVNLPHITTNSMVTNEGLQRMGNENDGGSSDTVTIIHSTRPSLIGRLRTCTSVTLLEWSLIALTALSIGFGLGFSIHRMATINWESPDFVFSILVIVNLLFATFYVFHGVFQEQPFEMLTLVMTTVLIWLLIMGNYVASVEVKKSLKFVRLSIVSVLLIPNILLALKVAYNYWTSGNLIFKTVGGDIKLQYMCRLLFFAFSLLAFDIQATVSCLVLIMNQGLGKITPEDALVIVGGLIFLGIWGSMGYVALRTEDLKLTSLFAICSILHPAYVVYLFVQAIDTVFQTHISVLTVSIYVTGITMALAHFGLLAIVFTFSHYYGQGLKERVYGESTVPTSSNTRITSSHRKRRADRNQTSEETPLLRNGPQESDRTHYDSILPAP